MTNDKGPSKNPVDIIDNNLISEIELLIADTTILDIPSTQLTRLIEVGEGQSFVDSNGTPLHEPTQRLIFKNSKKDSLIGLFNEFLKMRQQKIPTTCIILYRHVFILKNANHNINEQIDFAFDCPLSIDYLHRGIVIQPLEESKDTKKVLDKLVNLLQSENAFIPSYGPQPPPNN